MALKVGNSTVTLFAAFVLLCLFSIAAVYMANKVEYIKFKL